MKWSAWFLAASVLAVDWVTSVHAAQIGFSATQLGGTTWRYDYVVTNNGLAPIDEFTIFFDRNTFAALAVVASPDGWDSLVIQPDLSIPSDGFFDSLALGAGVANGVTLSGFSVSFDFSGQGSPGSQIFDVVDPETFAILQSGATADAMPVPEPTSTALLAVGSGLLAWAALSRRRSQLSSKCSFRRA